MQKTKASAGPSPHYLSRLLGEEIAALEPLEGGRNSKVYMVWGEKGTQYVAKLYFGATDDRRSRMAREISSLTFLLQQGITCVPRPIAADESRGCAVYEYFDGRKVPSNEVTDSDIDQTCQFLLRVHEAKAQEGSAELAPAAEACFSIQDIIGNINTRLRKLQVLDPVSLQYQALQEFLRGEFLVVTREVVTWCLQRLKDMGMTEDAELHRRDRTLSPSDFGFHNCLKLSNGQLVFLDFEHFGWDDPAKMLSDFLLHPAMDLTVALKQRFLYNLLQSLDLDGRLARRIEVVYPLFGLKWVLILLNEYLPEILRRRAFASGGDVRIDDLQREQLAKARRMLHTIRNTFEYFPYY